MQPLLHILQELPEYGRLEEIIAESTGPAAVFGLPEAHSAHIFAALSEKRGGILIAADEETAARLYAVAGALSGHIAILKAREVPLVNAYAASGEQSNQRIATLMRLALGEVTGVVASIEALMQRLAPPQTLRAAVRTLRAGDIQPPRELLGALLAGGYEHVELVQGRGQAALRGDILDVYPPQATAPIRVEFFDDEVDRLSEYDPETQRSLTRIEQALLPPATETPQDKAAVARALAAIDGAKGFDAQRAAFEENRPCPGAETLLPALYESPATLMDYLRADAVICIADPHNAEDNARAGERLFSQSIAAMLQRGYGIAAQAGLQLSADELFTLLHTPRTVTLQALPRHFTPLRPKEIVQFDARPAPRYNGDARELCRDITALLHAGAAALLFAGEQANSLYQQLRDEGAAVTIAPAFTRAPARGQALVTRDKIGQGFVYPALSLHLFSEYELYGVSRHSARRRRSDAPRLVFSDLRPGDFIVHEAHGVGRFVGVETLAVQNITRDYLLLEYAGGDRLYIPTDQLDRVQKYICGDEAPKLSKLGGHEWQRQVSRARGAVKELAFDLARLYAERQNANGFAFSPDTDWQKQMEARFPYQETPDQTQSIAEVKRDMESPRVMDRLLCGDVGYGKTEVALRAAFKAVQDGKQVAFLAPTTILAQQHYNTFCTRFTGFPMRVALLSRFLTPAQNKAAKLAVKEGKVDVVVGTHALLSKDVVFHDLGVLIVDEEQRFGVGHKEQIKALKANVDVLTLTATPIPRTLHMSLIGIRDLSVIDTPPLDRHPVQTYVMEYSDTLLRDALLKETNRGGQCYVVYNQVRRIESLCARMKALLPGCTVGYAHGQMPEAQLEQAMLDFLSGDTDILLCSTIIENGLDIGNANTLFVLEADKMGLSQLYQLRGRVGRTTRLGYAYFTFERNRTISEAAHKRLTALSEFAQFGAGREIALRDLEIRGAGSLLGARQHGHIVDIGYEYYCKLMASAVREARGQTPETPFAPDGFDAPDGFAIDTVVDVALDANIPKAYIRDEVQRLSMYKRIAMVKDGAGMLDVQEELEDRYGTIPGATQNLMDIALIKALCARAGVLSIHIGKEDAKLTFHEHAQLDGAGLIAVAASFGLQLLPGDELKLIYRKNAGGPHAMMQALYPLLDALMGCV
jgi:transcription-repair coupling factor (superfamily II helicase)